MFYVTELMRIIKYYSYFAGRVKAMDSKMEKAEELKIPVVPLDM